VARLEVKREMGRSDIAAVTELIERATDFDGHRPLDEHQWLDLVHGGREGFAGLVAWEPGHDHPVGYAQVSKSAIAQDGTGSWALEYVVDPHHRQGSPDISLTLVETALGVVADEGGGHVHLWVPKPTALHDDLAAAAGLRRGRELRQLRRSLPVGTPPTIELRAFEPGRDEEAWLDVNNRAFRWHPEQGDWDMEALLGREAQPWFDPAGLLLHCLEGRLAGFCWTKVHTDQQPPLGEIYVVAVDPAFQGRGLGRQLLLGGLDSLARRGLDCAMLYVDADSAAALHLYASLGFDLDHIDRAYVGDIKGR